MGTGQHCSFLRLSGKAGEGSTVREKEGRSLGGREGLLMRGDMREGGAGGGEKEGMNSMGKSLEVPSQSWIPITPHVDTELVISAISQTARSYPAPTVCLASYWESYGVQI